MHRVPRLQWKTWVRLAFVEAGSDWRSLNKLNVKDGKLADYLIIPEGMHHGMLGVNAWNEHIGTLTGKARPNNGTFSIADPRFDGSRHGTYGVNRWQDNTRTVAGDSLPSNGNFSVADPRMPESEKRQNGIYRVVKWEKQSHAVTGAAHVAGAALSVADPRPPEKSFSKYQVAKWNGSAGTVIGGDDHGAYGVADPRPGWDRHSNALSVMEWDNPSKTVIGGGKGVQGGWMSIADPRILHREKGDNYLTGGHYGVVPYDSPTGAVSASAGHDNGRWSVADPRIDQMPAQDQKLVAMIRALDGTWHRPFTTLELAALQSLVEPEEQLELDGLSDQAWRERIGNAVPPDAAAAIAGVMGTTLLLAWSGETFMLSSMPIWVRPVAVALSVQQWEPAA